MRNESSADEESVRAGKTKRLAETKRKTAPAALLQLAAEAFFYLPVFFLVAFGLSGRLALLHDLGPAQGLAQALVSAFAGWLLAGRPGFWRSLGQFAACLAISIAAAYLLLAEPAAIRLLAAGGFLFALRGRRLAYTPREAYFQPAASAGGLFSYLLLPVFIRLQPALEPYRGLLSAAGIAALGMFFLRLSRMNLLNANQQRDSRAAASLVWRNRLWALVLFGLVLLAGFLRPIGLLLQAGARAVWQQLVRFYLWLLPDGSNTPAPAAPSEPQNFPVLPEAAKRHPWQVVLEKIVEYAVWIALAALLLYLLYRGARGLPGLLGRWKAILARLIGRGVPDEAASYRDEKESLLELAETPRLLAGRMRQWFGRRFRKRESWDSLADNRERVRYLYRLLLKRAAEQGSKPLPAATPLEIGRELAARTDLRMPAVALAERYSDVRYGEAKPSDEEVDELAKSVFIR